MNVTPQSQFKVGLVATMFELLESTDHVRIASKIRLQGGPTTPEVAGAKSTHKPDIFARSPRGRMVLVETVTKDDMKDLDKLRDKLYLFYTASQCYDWDFHICCYRILAPHLKQFCSKQMIRYSKLWDL